MTGRRARRRQDRRSLSFTPGTTYDLGPVDSGPQNGTQGRDRAGWWALCGFLAGLGTGALAAAGVILR